RATGRGARPAAPTHAGHRSRTGAGSRGPGGGGAAVPGRGPGPACHARPVTETSAGRPPALDARDERHHEPGAEPWWNESWYFDFAAPDGSPGGDVRIGLYPTHGAARYSARVAAAGPPRATL